MKKELKIESIQFGKGKLSIFQVNHNDSNENWSEPCQKIKIILKYSDEYEENEITTLDDFKKLIEKKSFDVLRLINSNLIFFASFFSYLLGTGVVIRPTQRFLYLEINHKISLSQNSPRIENNNFRFIAIPFDLENYNPPVLDICINLINFSFEQKCIAKL